MSSRPLDFDGSQACAGADPNLFFPDRNSDARAAQKLCKPCSWRVRCLEYALSAPAGPRGRYVDGVWGGTTAPERARLRRERQATA